MGAKRTAAQLYAYAVAEGNAGRHAAMRRALRTALTRDPDPDTAALITGSLAYLDAERASPADAIAQIDAALDGTPLRDTTRAVVTGQRGLLELRRGNADAAVRDFGTAIDALADEPLSLGRVHLNRGLVRLDRAQYDGAEQDFADAADAFARAGEHVEQAKAHGNAGYAAMLRGDLATAIRTMDEAGAVLGPLSPVMRAIGDTDRAEALLAAGMTSDAAELLAAAVEIYGARRLREAQAEAETALARALLVDDPSRAAAVARRAARRFRERGNESWATRADALVATGSLRGGRVTPRDRRVAAKVADDLEALHRVDDAALLRLELALAELEAGNADRARVVRAGVRTDSDTSIAVQVRAEEVAAGLAMAEGDASAVLDAAGRGISTLVTWQSSLGSLELHSSAAVHGTRLAVLGMRAALDRGSPAEVLDWSERVRALGGSIRPLRPPADTRVADALAELRELRRTPRPSDASNAREATLRDEVRRAHWASSARPAESGHTVALDELHDALAADRAAFIAHVWAGDRIAALVVAPGIAADGRVVELGPAEPVTRLLSGLYADLDMAAATLPAVFRESAAAALHARLAALDRILLAPLAPHLRDADRIVLTSAGALAGIPWPMLDTSDGRALVVAESARRWLDSRGARPARHVGFAAGPDVARAGAEIASCAIAWGDAAERIDGVAAASDVTAIAGEVDLLHIAAHGRHAAEHPLFSGFELADGPWFGYDIDQLGRVPDVVVMSACELGRSSHRWGLEALGMSRAWLHAGVRSVVASPAAIADDHAGELLPAVHERIARGAGVADALSDATRATGLVTPLLARGAGW